MLHGPRIIFPKSRVCSPKTKNRDRETDKGRDPDSAQKKFFKGPTFFLPPNRRLRHHFTRHILDYLGGVGLTMVLGLRGIHALTFGGDELI